MNIVKKIEQYDENSIFFCEPIKNTIMNEGTFIRILYSTNNITLNDAKLVFLRKVNLKKINEKCSQQKVFK